VEATEAELGAWTYLDPEHALAQARAADEERRSGAPLGPLHGVPVGLKDIIDTADMPTENGSPLHAGRTPARDAAVVERLRATGAVLLGKTVTTEFAGRAPGKTRNPVNPAHTPGGSSSGSAAAVAASQVPLAVGSQTGGSVIRPAAYCGVFGFKPTHGLISRHGMFQLSRSLDHVGVFARTLEDVALLAEVLVGFDARDPDSRASAHPPYREIAASEPPIPPLLAFVKTARWEQVDPDAREACAELVEFLGDRVEELDLGEPAVQALEWHRIILDSEMAANLDWAWEGGRARLSPSMVERLARGREVRARDYLQALARRPALNAGFDELFAQRYDAILTPAASGTAPRGLESTGDPAFNAVWTLCGMPALTVPLMQGENGLPLGVQLVGPRLGDARLLRTARWLVDTVQAG